MGHGDAVDLIMRLLNILLISEKIPKNVNEIYEFVIDLKIPDMGKISIHILKFKEFCFTHEFTGPCAWKIEEMVYISK